MFGFRGLFFFTATTVAIAVFARHRMHKDAGWRGVERGSRMRSIDDQGEGKRETWMGKKGASSLSFPPPPVVQQWRTIGREGK